MNRTKIQLKEYLFPQYKYSPSYVMIMIMIMFKTPCSNDACPTHLEELSDLFSVPSVSSSSERSFPLSTANESRRRSGFSREGFSTSPVRMLVSACFIF